MLKSFLTFLLERFSKTENANKRELQNGKAGLFRSDTIIKGPWEELENEEGVNPDENDGYISRDVLSERSSDGKSESRAERTRRRLAELMQWIPRLKELQWDVTAAQIEARQKMREVGFKRSAVSRADANFMRELQLLQAEGQLEPFKQLSRLADACQSARDVLGPLEVEGMEAQQKFEGRMWELQQEEGEFFSNLESDFGEDYEESSMTSDTSSAHNILQISPLVIGNNHELRDQQDQDTQDKLYPSTSNTSNNERVHGLPNASQPINRTSRKVSVVNDLRMLDSHEDQRQAIAPIRPHHSVESLSSIPLSTRAPFSFDEKNKSEQQDSLFLGLENGEFLGHQESPYEPTLALEQGPLGYIENDVQQSEPALSSDSGGPNLDSLENDNLTTGDTKRHLSTEPFPKLLTHFATRRDRINKWLLHTMLVSKSEANLIGLQLQKEPASSPSPWAQLIIAYLEFDHNISKAANNTGSKDASVDDASEIPDYLTMPQSKTTGHQGAPGDQNDDKMNNLYSNPQPKVIVEDIATTPTIHPPTTRVSEPQNSTAEKPICEQLPSQLERPDSNSSSFDVPSPKTPSLRQ